MKIVRFQQLASARSFLITETPCTLGRTRPKPHANFHPLGSCPNLQEEHLLIFDR
jgi:hypothetical protein